MSLWPVMAFAQPVISFDSEVHDFAIVSGSSDLRYSFEVYNRGTEDLLIEKLYPS
jgi:hypothetical protein